MNNEFTEIVFNVSVMQIGIKMEMNETNNDASLSLVIEKEIRQIIKTKEDAIMFGIILAVNANGMNNENNASK